MEIPNKPVVIELDVSQSQGSSFEIPLISSQISSSAPTTSGAGPVAFVPGVGVLPRGTASDPSKPSATKPVDEKFIDELFNSQKDASSASETDSGSESDTESTSSSNSNKLTESTGVKKSKTYDVPLSQGTLGTAEKPAAPAALKVKLIASLFVWDCFIEIA
jgi:hypothetical protein